MDGEIPEKRWIFRKSTIYSRQSTKQSICAIDVNVDVCSGESFHRSGTGVNEKTTNPFKDSSSSSELDFLCIPLLNSHESSFKKVEKTVEKKEAQHTSRRQPRKQVRPKKRKTRVIKKIIKNQSTTKLLIPRAPFQRYVKPNETKKKTCKTFAVIISRLLISCFLLSLYAVSFVKPQNNSLQIWIINQRP